MVHSGLGPLFSSGKCPSRILFILASFFSSQSPLKMMICLFGSPKTLQMVNHLLRLAANPGTPWKQDRLCATRRQGPQLLGLHQLIPTSGFLHLLFPPWGSFPHNLSHDGSSVPFTSQLKCHPDLKIHTRHPTSFPPVAFIPLYLFTEVFI